MPTLTRILRSLLIPAAALPLAAGAVSISDVPLLVTTSVNPNVMLLLDNSGSLDNIIWSASYSASTDYPNWGNFSCSPSGGGSANPCWTATDGNVHLDELQGGTCGSGAGVAKIGKKSGTTKCLRLPDPVGGQNTRYGGNYLNYLFETYANNTNLGQGQIPATTRLPAMKTAATTIINGNPALRFGIANFNAPNQSSSGPGGRVVANCGTSTATLLTTISGLGAIANTPLAETFYEVTRYFRGLSSYYNSSLTYTSPLQYRCQKNFVIVVTDGFPTYDTSFPTNDPADTANTAASLPNWDGLAPSSPQTDFPIFPPYSDGFKPTATEASEAYSLYLDDLAKFGNDLDLKTSGTDLAGGSWQDPNFLIQNLVTYTVGLTTASQSLQDAATYGDGIYYTANDAEQLTIAVQSAIGEIIARSTSASSVASNSTQLNTQTRLYQARFSAADWSGQLLLIPVNANGTIGSTIWDAGTLLPAAAQRNLWTYNAGAAPGSHGIAFQWASLISAQQTALNTTPLGVNDGNGQARLNYLRGDRSNEAPAGLDFRTRNRLLGDIVNSDPLYVKDDDFGFQRLPGAEGTSYLGYRASSAHQSRPAMIYVGANDGMLHAFDATTGVERFGYIPNALFANLSRLPDPAYTTNHRFSMDGSPRISDAYLNGQWETVLVSSLGAGGPGIFALKVTDPANFTSGNVLWEFTASQDTDLGVGIPQATIVRLYNGRWGAIVANGYNSANRRAVLFVLDLASGEVLREIDTGVGSLTLDNGLSSPVPVDIDNDRIVDYVYAGDLQGNLWKFDLTSSNPSTWDVAFHSGSTAVPLYTACSGLICTSGNRQAITARPDVGLNPEGGTFVYFGTGRYFATGDNIVPALAQVQSFYAIEDHNDKFSTAPLPSAGRFNLLAQTILGITSLFGEQQRITSNLAPLAIQDGWYIDLPVNGERQVSTPLLHDGRVIFTTLIPSSVTCGFGGDSWLMELDALTGSRPDTEIIDINRDGLFTALDIATLVGLPGAVPVSGRLSTQGIIKIPRIVESLGIEYKYASGTSGGIDITNEKNTDDGGRQSWRQIY